jgi:hypothetical protein
MHEDNLSKISRTVIKQFTKTVVELDKKANFVKRKSKLGASTFVESMVFGCLSDPTISLERLSGFVKQRGIKISKQGIHQRFTPEAVTLMKYFYIETMKQFTTDKCEILDLLRPFSAVTMVDSSTISLPENLKNLYKGSGGAASEAAIKIQVLYDYIQGQISDITITEGCKNDQSYDGHLNKIERGTLHLQDLGYFKLKSFAAIQEKNAYFISRYFHATTIMDEKNESINLIKTLRKAGRTFARTVWLGGKEKIKIRLIALRLPPETIEKRIRKIKENARRKGHTPTRTTLELAQWSIYITNVPEELLTNEQIHMVYALRWQIELFFKLCKSEAGIDKVRGKKISRVLCEIYAKLTCVIMLLHLCFSLRWRRDREISFVKAYKMLSARAINFFRVIKSRHLLTKFFRSFFDFLRDFAYKDRPSEKKLIIYRKLMNPMLGEALV